MGDSENPGAARESVAVRRHGRLFRWLDRRAAIDSILHDALDEPIPGGASLAYIFGSGLLFIFLSQVITGVFLAMYYVPSADHAHVTVAYITKVVTSGAFLRSIHAYGAAAMIIVLVLHWSQVVIYGAYKGRRELLWLSGCILMFLILGMAFTGYLLPWDQKAYFATVVGTNLLGDVPFIGERLQLLLRGGTTMGTLTLSRFYVLHVFLLPAGIFAFIAIHVYLFRRAGAAGPFAGDPEKVRRKTQAFYPRQLLMDLVFALVLIGALAYLAHFHPVELGPPANPAETNYLPRPEWYYRFFFQWLKYWQGSLEVIGAIVIPSLVALFFILVPFLDRRGERRPWKRPVALNLLGLFLFSCIGLGALSYWDDAHNPLISEQLRLQDVQTEKYMKAPFQPFQVGGEPAPTSAANLPLVSAGREVFQTEGCVACHGQNATGTAIAPSLVGITSKIPPERIAVIVRHPTPQMKKGGMPAFHISDHKMKSLLAYLGSLK